MRARRRELWTLVAAIALHAAAVGVLRIALPQPTLVLRSGVTSPLSDLSWDVEVGQATSPLRERNSSARTDPRPAPRARFDAPASEQPSSAEASSTNADASPRVGPAETAAAVGEPTPDAVSPVLPASPSGPESPSARPIDLGISPDGWQRWVGPPGERTATAGEPRVRSNRFQVYRAAPVSTTGGVQEGLEKRDLELGLGPSGRVLSALHHTAHESIAPAAGKATFEVTVLGTGAVEVRLGSASAQTEEWQGVARRIAERLRAEPPRIAPPRRGARFVVELIAEETMPNGTRIKDLAGPHFDAVAPRLSSTEDEQRKLELDNPTGQNGAGGTPQPPIKLDLPGVYLAERGKVCSYRLGLSAVGPVFQGGCDPSHIGAKPQRMVRARVLEQTLF